jgi:hypothetical protein
VERTTIAGETEELGEKLPQRHFVPPQIPHDQVRFRTADRSGGKPATNRLSYGSASLTLTGNQTPIFPPSAVAIQTELSLCWKSLHLYLR